MCDIQDDLSSIPDASLLIIGLDHQSAEGQSEIAHHEYLPASRGHDPSVVHHGPAAEDPCNTIMQRYLPLRPPCISVTANSFRDVAQICLLAPSKCLHGQQHPVALSLQL